MQERKVEFKRDSCVISGMPGNRFAMQYPGAKPRKLIKYYTKTIRSMRDSVDVSAVVPFSSCFFFFLKKAEKSEKDNEKKVVYRLES